MEIGVKKAVQIFFSNASFEMIYLEPGHIRPLRKFARIKVSKTFFMIAVVTAYFLLSIFEWIIPHFSSFFQYPICILGNRISL